MPARARLFYVLLGFVLLPITALPLYRDLTRPKDIWWTPAAMMIPLADGGDRVEIYVRGQPVTALLEAGQLQIVEGGGSSPVRAGEVGLRFNNWDRVRARGFPGLLASAAGFGAIMSLLVVMLTGRLAYREERASPTEH